MKRRRTASKLWTGSAQTRCFFASTTAPYAEKAHSALVATALDLGNVFAADFAQCTKAAVSALRLALDSCYASRCKSCGMTMFPVNRVCEGCHSLDDYETFRAPDHKVKIFTYTLDNYAGRSDFPLLGHIIAEDEFGTRYYMNSTDFKREDIQVGAEMEFTFRKIHNLAGFVNYYCKVRPVRRVQGGNDNG